MPHNLNSFFDHNSPTILEDKTAGRVMDFLQNTFPKVFKKEEEIVAPEVPLQEEVKEIKEEPNTEFNTIPTNTEPNNTLPEFFKNYKPNEMTNIEGVIPEEHYKDLPTLEQAIRNEIPEHYEAVLNQFYPYLTDYNIHKQGVDISFDALYFLGLGGLGGKQVIWQLGREFYDEHTKKEKDMEHCKCDINHANLFDINTLLNFSMQYANEKGFDPPAPMFGMANHPYCRCSLTFNKSDNFTDYTSIQNGCPGLPQNAPQEDTDKAKKVIFDSIPEVIYINSGTFPPLYITEKTANIHHVTTKYGSVKKAESEPLNKPISIRKDSIAIMNMGFWTPINQGWVGFALNDLGSYVEVFLVDLMYKVKVKKDNIEYVENLTESSDPLSKDTNFIISDDKLGIFCYKRHDGSLHAYFPEIDNIIEIENPTILK
jgi:hypothetical protein